MASPIIAAAVCCGVVVSVAVAWDWLGAWLKVGIHPMRRLRHRQARQSLTPPMMWLGSGLVLAGIGVRYPFLVPLVGGVTMQALSLGAARLVGLATEIARIGAERAGVVLFSGVVGGWTWVLSSGRSSSLAWLAGLVLMALLIVEQMFSRVLDIATRTREIRATGLRPVILSDPGWQLDVVDVLPDRDAVCVRYVRRRDDRAVWIDLPGTNAVDTGGWDPVWIETGLWRLRGPGAVWYFAIVGDQVARLELDGGVADDTEVHAVLARLETTTPRELACLELGPRPPAYSRRARRRPAHRRD